MSKVIVGKALKNNKKLTNNENLELEFSIKYQILSKSTALFAQMINNNSQQSKLIKVELNKPSEINNNDYLGNFNHNVFMPSSNVYSEAVKCCARAPRLKKKKLLGFDLFGGLKNIFSSKE